MRGETHIVIRPVRAEDAAELMELYDALDVDDRYRRFFNAYHPGHGFFDELATVAERGGARLVAVLRSPPPAADRIIGEAGYTMLPNGDGELAITVARGWRGWLGPYLLDALVETAAANGVPNLEADVLTVNGPMLALLRSRGCVVMEHEGWSVVRLLIGTANRPPTWPGPHDRLRVLVEGPGGRWHAEDEARSAGLQLLMCPGPGDGRRKCPALSGEPCPLAAEADIVVVSHPADDARWHGLLTAHANVHPGVPVCLEPSQPPGHEELPVTVCPFARETDVVSFVQHVALPGAPPVV
jgi:hypothetical protein